VINQFFRKKNNYRDFFKRKIIMHGHLDYIDHIHIYYMLLKDFLLDGDSGKS